MPGRGERRTSRADGRLRHACAIPPPWWRIAALAAVFVAAAPRHRPCRATAAAAAADDGREQMDRVGFSIEGEIVEGPRPVNSHDRSPTDGSSGPLPPLSREISFLLKYGVSMSLLQQVENRARELNLPPAHVLLANGQVTELAYYRLMARELGLDFSPVVPNGHDQLSKLPKPTDWRRIARMASHAPQCSTSLFNQRQADFFMAPDGWQFDGLRQLLRQYPEFSHRLQITTHGSGLNHLIRRAEPLLMAHARDQLRNQRPDLSAAQVVTFSQTVVLMLLIEMLTAVSLVGDAPIQIALHVPALLAYFSQAGLRLSSWASLTKPRQKAIEQWLPDACLPTYSVLVALYKEANQVDDLIAALARLDWPKEKLEVKLLFEADDLDSIAACHRALAEQNAPFVSIITVPAGLPRTKPKALNYALPLCSGELLVVYDAEDRPDPGQLREAHAAFLARAPELACLQAPLSIHNHRDGWLPRLFAIEYSAHFDGLLPALARYECPMPLGGSSNHFKRQALVNIGAWDPYNVTEDADLGIRLARAGCAVGTICCPTFEEAPNVFAIWLRQRTRWFKGCYQTWLVHMRHPLVLYGDLGPARFLAFQLVTLAAALGALFQPFLIYFVSKCLIDLLSGSTPTWRFVLACIDMMAMVCVLFIWCLLASKTLRLRQLQSLRPYLIWALVYWLLISIAAWRALWQLFACPHDWEKTPHTAMGKPIA
ncbi:MAG: glycosyltransferase [Rhizobiaceae bacterium]|nr:glycosyltransferase [Rhizobiaceae bacterium]